MSQAVPVSQVAPIDGKLYEGWSISNEKTHYTNIHWCWGQHWKNNAPQLCMIEANSQYVLLYHKINVTNLCRHPWCINIEYALICLILRSDQKSMQIHGVTWFTTCSLETWITWCHVPREHDTALTKPGNIVYFLHIKWRTLDQSRSRNSDRNITKEIDQPSYITTARYYCTPLL